ncbi:MAG TPA: tRNA glutamyl-Q(34) synthetase GluQRS [Tepidisphaeraceae bacterium]|nr:tRNA glutamyl-Q(34) synthetase GluQRS [Tepidisphaeraceae bacterium]
MPAGITRLAPSPTGALHLGNARTFLITWLIARQRGWSIELRIDDIDGPRVKPHATTQALDDLRWLGIDHDTGPTMQSARHSDHARAIESLIALGKAYPCVCTRTEIEQAASAPHAEDGASVYPGTCRGRFRGPAEAIAQTGRAPCWRFVTDDRPIEFVDGFLGRQRYVPFMQLGDFVIQKADGTPAYQLATVVDDHAAGVTHVIRGDDLLDSTPRQILLYHALYSGTPPPHYIHLPLVVGEDGRRLAKRHGDTRISQYREAGVPPSKVRGLLARWSGIDCDAIDLPELLKRFDLQVLPRERVVFTRDDDRRLRG